MWSGMFSGGKDLRRDAVGGGLASDELLPGLGALVDDVHGVATNKLVNLLKSRRGAEEQAGEPLVLALASESELVLGLAIRDLVDAEPLVSGPEKAGKVPLDVLNVVELGGEGVLDVDDDDLPVGLLLVEEGHDAENLDLLHLTGVADELTDLADVERVIVTLGLGLGVNVVGVLPGLRESGQRRSEIGGAWWGSAGGRTWGKAP